MQRKIPNYQQRASAISGLRSPWSNIRRRRDAGRGAGRGAGCGALRLTLQLAHPVLTVSFSRQGSRRQGKIPGLRA